MCGAFCDLVPFVQLKKREKHPWRSVDYSEVGLYKWYQIAQRITYISSFEFAYLLDYLTDLFLIRQNKMLR